MAALGELEQAVMDALWQASQPMAVRDVHEQLLEERPLAYTTVMTVLDRLAKKRIVRRELAGRAWYYQPAISLTQLLANEIVSLLQECTPTERAEVWHQVHRELGEPAPAN